MYIQSKFEDIDFYFCTPLGAVCSGANSCCNKALFMKQRCQIQMGVGQYKNAATPLRTRAISTTHQHFEPLEKNQSYVPHLKVLVCGINSFSSQWCVCILKLSYTHLNFALLLHKQGLVATGVASTVA